MVAPSKWIKQFLGLKKSDKTASSEEENSSENVSKGLNQNKSSAENEKSRFENELNDNGEIEYEDANWQWEMDQAGGAPSTSLEAKSSAQVSDDRKEENAAQQQQPQEDWREEWMEIYAKDANNQSALDSPDSTEVENEGRVEEESGEGWATPDVREPLESDPDPDSPNSSSIEVEDALLDVEDNTREEFEGKEQLEQSMEEGLAVKRIQTAIRGFLNHPWLYLLITSSHQLQNGGKAETPQPLTEESAAIRIQTVYRGFRARRAFRAIKGLARLQALVKGHTVKRQSAIALRCIQVLVKAQAQSRAKHIRIASENQSVQQKLMQQLEVEAPALAPAPAPARVKKPQFKFDGWCDKVGSAAEVQARMLKRQEAAAKREKARAYALARQWQAGKAGIRHQPQPQSQPQPQPQPQQQQQQKEEELASGVGFHTVKTEWGWNWLERWTAVRPWETHFIEEAKEGNMSPVDEQRSPLNERKLSSRIWTVKTSPRLSDTVEKRVTDGCSPSPRKSGITQETPTTPVSSRSPRIPAARPNFISRSFSTPRERSTLSDGPEKKRLSLPGTMSGAKLLAQTAVKSPRTQSPRTHSPKALSPRVQSPRTPQSSRSKLNTDTKPSKLSR